MEKTIYIECNHKPNFCPTCGKTSVVDILYGFPTESAIKDAEAGRLVLGGCIIDAPNWQCTSCEQDIHRTQNSEDDGD